MLYGVIQCNISCFFLFTVAIIVQLGIFLAVEKDYFVCALIVNFTENALL